MGDTGTEDENKRNLTEKQYNNRRLEIGQRCKMFAIRNYLYIFLFFILYLYFIFRKSVILFNIFLVHISM